MHTRAVELSSSVLRISTPFRIQFTVLVLLCGWILAAFSSPLVSEKSAWAIAANSLGWLCFCAGALLRFWSICHIAGRKTRIAVDTGPYALCRNPLYLGTFLIIASEAAFLKSIWFALALVALISFYHLLVVPGEEQKLKLRLGGQFTEYAERVPRWIPRFHPRCLEDTAILDRAAILAEIRCLLCWSLVPVVGLATCALRTQPWWPHYVPGF